ncbi:glycosyltransferase family 4 protein [Phocaeicola sp.]
MKVLQLLKTSTGAIWALRQMRELVNLGVEVYVAMPLGGTLVPLYKEAGVKICYMDFSLKDLLKSCRDLRRIVKMVDPDIIHSHFVITTLVMRLALRNDKRPRIFQVPGPLHLENYFFRNLELILRQKNDFWVGSCKWTNERYRKSGIKNDKIYLSYYGTDVHRGYNYIKGKLKKEILGLKDDDILVGIVAYMYAPKKILGQKRGLKGHEDLIDAIALLKNKYPNLYCVCIGGPYNGAVKYEYKLKEYANRKVPGRILFTGTLHSVSEVYNDLFCVIHPSLSENLGGAAESLLLGVPTISSNVGGFPDIVIDRVTGVIVPPKNPLSIANAIEGMINHTYDTESMVEEGKKRTLMLMDINNSVRTIYSIYKQIINV